MATHELKTWPEYFAAIVSGVKTFEIRKDDRHFEVGDTLVLRKWEPMEMPDNWGFYEDCPEPGGAYTGEQISRLVTYCLRNCEALGVVPGFVVMGLAHV